MSTEYANNSYSCYKIFNFVMYSWRLNKKGFAGFLTILEFSAHHFSANFVHVSAPLNSINRICYQFFFLLQNFQFCYVFMAPQQKVLLFFKRF